MFLLIQFLINLTISVRQVATEAYSRYSQYRKPILEPVWKSLPEEYG